MSSLPRLRSQTSGLVADPVDAVQGHVSPTPSVHSSHEEELPDLDDARRREATLDRELARAEAIEGTPLVGDRRSIDREVPPHFEQPRPRSETPINFGRARVHGFDNASAEPDARNPPLIDPATFQQSMFAMMQQLTRAVAGNPRSSATPFDNRIREPKVNDPEVFDGQPDKLNSFLTECSIVFDLQRSRFPDDTTKITYMISFLRKSPLLAIRPYLAEYPRPSFLTSYVEFTAYLKTSYGDPDEEGTARRKYRACVQKGSASAYFSELRQHLAVLGWSEHSEPVVDKAIEGLKPSLKDELARREHRPTSLAELVRYIVPLDNRLHVREQEKKKEQGTSTETASTTRKQITPAAPARTTTSTYTSTSTTSAQPPRSSAPATTSSSNVTYPRGPLSEEEKERRRKNGLCLYCGLPGHISFDCPARQSKEQKEKSRGVRYLDDSEQGNESAESK